MEKIYTVSKPIETTSFGYFLKQIKHGSKVLEFGPATGYMTQYMKEVLGCKVTCIELCRESAKIAEQYAEKMIVANIENDPWEKELDQKYDYILFADVLEHLRYPEETLKKAIQFLAPEGFLITSIPNIGHSAILLALRKGKFEYTKYGLLDDSHIHFFTRNSMCNMFEKNSLICVEERNEIRRPAQTELKEYYWKYPIFSLSLFRKPDAHVYQFICMWTINQKDTIPIKKRRGKKFPIFFFPIVYFLDFKDYLHNKYNLSLRFLYSKK